MSLSPSTPSPLSRRLTRRAIDLLVAGFVVSVGLSVGRQLVDWWREDPATSAPDLSSLPGNDLDWARSPVRLQFGDLATAMERIPFRGGRKEIEDELTKIGQAIVNSADPPTAAMLEPEQGMLEALQAAPPVFWDSDRGNVYRRFEPMPSFVATRFVEAEPGANQALPQRIVGWALAFPTAPTEWTIYVFQPQTGPSQQKSPDVGIALPPGARNITRLTGRDGCQWQVFEGRGSVSSWVQHFRDVFGETSLAGSTVDAQSARLKYRREHVMTELQIRQEWDGSLTGVAWSAQEGETR